MLVVPDDVLIILRPFKCRLARFVPIVFSPLIVVGLDLRFILLLPVRCIPLIPASSATTGTRRREVDRVPRYATIAAHLGL